MFSGPISSYEQLPLLSIRGLHNPLSTHIHNHIHIHIHQYGGIPPHVALLLIYIISQVLGNGGINVGLPGVGLPGVGLPSISIVTPPLPYDPNAQAKLNVLNEIRMIIDREVSKLSRNPFARGTVKKLMDVRQRIDRL